MATLSVNPALLVPDEEDATKVVSPSQLPQGVFWLKDLSTDDSGRPMPPDGWVELFQADNKAFCLPKRIDPRIAFRYLRAIRKGRDETVTMADMLYDVLGEGVIDALAEFELTDEENAQVMAAVEKYATGALKTILGN